MLTRLQVKNFKRFEVIDISLGRSVVLIGPNNSGKTTALQAISLWELGMRQWIAKRQGKDSPKKRPGVTINRRDVASIPIPAANLLWRNLHTRDVIRKGESQQTSNIRIDIALEGIHGGKAWSCGFEFDYSNEESFVCRPLRLGGFENSKVGECEFTGIPDEARHTQVAFLPPMSGLSDREHLKQGGEIAFLVGQGQTAQVLRNLCHQVSSNSDSNGWSSIKSSILDLFGARLNDPIYLSERSEIILEYEESGITLDLSSAGRGLQQTLLLLTHLYANPNTVLLLDEPDAHLEILRQRQIYDVLSDVSQRLGAQIIAASHSEVVLNEAAGRGTVVAFVGTPHTINDRGSQLLKSLTSIGWEQYFQAEEAGWVLYLESATDLCILKAFAERLNHSAKEALARPFVKYVSTNLPQVARDHFFGLKEAKPDLVGLALFDRIDGPLQDAGGLRELMWVKREIENYLCSEQVLMDYSVADIPDDLFAVAEKSKRRDAMVASISDVQNLLSLDEKEPWSADVKASDEVLDRVFRAYYKRLALPITFRKADYHALANLMPIEAIDPEVTEKLDIIYQIYSFAGKNR